jgi:hypothetical protein
VTVTAVPLDSFPHLAVVRQSFAPAPPLDVGRAVADGVAALPISPGARIAVGVGSRGITRLAEVVKATVDALVSRGAQPFIVPAMGSHGGGTAEGQRALLADYGVTEASMGVPLDAEIAADRIGDSAEGVPVFFSQTALAADGLVFVNRIKPHTDFRGPLGSGLCKMLVIGLGKHMGAATCHRAAARLGHEAVLRGACAVIMARARVLGGVALVENALHQLARVEVVPAAALLEREAVLLDEARNLMARLPYDDLDFVVIDRIGKNISGTGMDPNVVGRSVNGYISALSFVPDYRPIIRRILVCGLTPESHGNASGLGMADFTTERTVAAMNANISYTNALTSLSLQSSKIPIVFADERTAIASGLSTLGLPDPRRARFARISDTLNLETLEVSESCLDDPASRALSVVVGPRPMRFDDRGNLLALGTA